MSRDLEDDNYYTSSGGLIPIKWTAIEVSRAMQGIIMNTLMYNRHFISRSTPQPVMCGALVCSCMRYGVWDTNHLII